MHLINGFLMIHPLKAQQIPLIKSKKPLLIGTYSVRVTSDSGLERIIPITIVHAVHASTLIGDINQDSAVDLADIVWLQAYLIGTREATTSFWNTADMNQDTIVNGFDLSWLKRTVLDTK